MNARKHFYKSQMFAHIVLGVIFILVGSFWILTGYQPSHDVIEVHGLSHYFYSSIARGVIPYWNPYTQTGTPFFPYFQAGGFLTPLQFFCILLQVLTGCTTLTTYVLHYLLDLMGHGSAVRIAQNDYVCATIDGLLYSLKGIGWVVIVPIKKMLRIIDDFPAMLFQKGQGILDHGEILI